MIPGAADTEQTRAHLSGRPMLSSSRELGRTGLCVSAAGFGCYRVDADVPAHREALEHALGEGINLIDTSANYSDGGSERLVGEVLAEMIDAGSLSRQGVVVVSKAGYLQGQNFELSRERKRQERPFPELVEYADGLEHCIHPEFLEDQLTRSLDRLGLETLDVYLLHNPEYFLGWAHRAAIPPDEARKEYDRRIEAALRYLETEVDRGRIAWYGISSNTFPHSATDPEFTSLERVLALAESIGPGHHMAVIQMPMNLLETGAATESNQRDGVSVLELALGRNLGVLINRPLNAVGHSGMLRLADPHSEGDPVTPSEIRGQLEELQRLEEDFAHVVLRQIPISDEQRGQLLALLSSAAPLVQAWDRLGGVAHWRELHGRHLVPRIQAAVGALLQLREVLPSLLEWIEPFVSAANRCHQSIAWFYEQQAREGNRAIRGAVAEADPDWAAPSLSQAAVRALRSTEGVSCVLVGMRQRGYVDDVLAELRRPVDSKPRAGAWHRLRSSLQPWR